VPSPDDLVVYSQSCRTASIRSGRAGGLAGKFQEVGQSSQGDRPNQPPLLRTIAHPFRSIGYLRQRWGDTG